MRLKKVDEIEKETKKIYPLQGQVKLQMENNYIDEKIETLTLIIVGLQKNLNKIDGESRNCSVIITGVPEKNLVLPVTSTDWVDSPPIPTDLKKSRDILCITHTSIITPINNLLLHKLVKNTKGNRAIKVQLPSNEERDNLLKNMQKLKDAGELWKKIYLKKDLHPIYTERKP